MEIQGFDHIELYVGDAQTTAFLLCTAFGFRVAGQAGPETGLHGQRSLLLRQGNIDLVLTSALADGHRAARYVAAHGDGVAAIGFATDDAAEAFSRAVARGAEPVAPPLTHADEHGEVVTATVTGFGDVVHRLVTRRGARTSPGRAFLPGVMEMVEDPDAGQDLLDAVDHVAVCLPAGDLDPTVRWYREVFGFSQIFDEYIDVGGQGMLSKVVQSPTRGGTFTLIEPDITRRPGQIDDFLHWHGGAGVQHVAFHTRDIVAAVRALAGHGVRFASTPASYYDEVPRRVGRLERSLDDLREVGVLVDQDRWGRMYQIFTQSMHVRRTLFLELIERHGALTFGSGNIRALYEAKERELGGTHQPVTAKATSTTGGLR